MQTKIKKIFYQTRIVLLVFPIFSVLFVTFFISNELANGIVSGKYFWFYLSMGLIAVSLPIFLFTKKKSLIRVNDALIVSYIIILLLTFTFTNHEVIATKHILLILLINLYFIFRFIFIKTNKNIIYWLIVCFIITGLVESIWGLRQLYGFERSQHGLFKITGSFFNPGPYACYLAVIFPMAFYYTLRYRICYKVKLHFRNIPIYLLWGVSMLTVVSSILVLPAAMSRTAWIACVGGCGLVVMYFLAKNKNVKSLVIRNRKKCILAASIAILLIVAGGFGMYKLKKDSADGRTFIWKNTIELIKQNPFGVGIGSFSGSYGHVQAAYFESGKGTEDEKRVAGNPEYAFNEYLQICAEQGIVAFLLFMCIIGYSLYIGIKRKKIAATSSLLALLIAAGASYPFSVLPFLIVFVFLLALIHNGEKGIAIPKLVSVALAFCGVIIVSLCLYNRYPTYDAYKKWNRVKMLYSFGNNKDASEEYRNIYPLLSDQIQFLFEYVQCLNKSEQYEESNEVLEKAVKISCDPMLYNIMGKNYQAMKLYVEAERCFMKSSNIVPNRIYPYYLMTLMYVDSGEMEKAKTMAEVVLTKEPKVQSTAVREMRNEVKKLLE
jgi:Lipid A core - O-antigen ligase and related enzymes